MFFEFLPVSSFRSRSKSPPCTSRQWDQDKRQRYNDHQEKQTYEWGKPKKKEDFKITEHKNEGQPPRELPNFETMGKLAEDLNKYKGVVIKYNEPPEACRPKVRWRLYPFKSGESLATLYVHRQSAYLIGN